MIITRILIGLAAGGLLTIVNTYTAYSGLLPALHILKTHRHPVKIVADTVTQTGDTKKTVHLIKAPEDALTLSRFQKDGQVHTLAVLEDDGQTVTGVDISIELKRYDLNAFQVIKNSSFDEVVKVIRAGKKKVAVKYTDLLPAVAGKEHLAIGINYAEHGKETGQVRPFMFPN